MSVKENISIFIGSWGSYNSCNERALGSKWLDLSEFDEWEDIEEELKKEGFVFDGIDEELFIQDIENLPSKDANWDYMSPEKLFNALKESEVLENSYKHDLMTAFLEVRSLDEFFELVDFKGSHWDDDINLYKGFDWEDYGREMFDCCEIKIDDRLLDFFDFEAYGEYMGNDYAAAYSNGIIEIMN